MLRSRPPSRPTGPLPVLGRASGKRWPGLRARSAANAWLILTTSLCVLAFGALLVPGAVFGAEDPASDLDMGPSAVSPSVESEAPDHPTAPRVSMNPGDSTDGTLLVTLPWGDGDGEVGLRAPGEGLTQGPEALAVAPDGKIAVLDSVNRRVVFLDVSGRVTGSTTIPLSGARFLAVDADLLYVLDCDADEELVALDWQGTLLETLSLPALSDVVTGLFATIDGPCVEVAHRDTFLVSALDSTRRDATSRVLGPTAVPLARDETPQTTVAVTRTGEERASSHQAFLRVLAGRPLDRGMQRMAEVTFSQNTGARVRFLKAEGASSEATTVQDFRPSFAGDRAVDHLVSVDGDGRDGLIIGARLLQPEMRDGAPAFLMLSRLVSGTGGPAGTRGLGGTGSVEETMFLSESTFAYLGQPYVVAPDGRIYQPVGSADGYSIYIYSFPGSDPALDPEEARP